MDTTEIIVAGCGPTGAMVSALLSQYSIPHIILERDLEVNSDPRGIALDEDGIRYLQACGIYDKIFTEIGQCMGKFTFVGGTHRDLSRKPFMTMDYNTTEGGTGHPGFLCHKQPFIESNLRERIKTLGVADMRLGARVTSIREDDEWVYVSYADPSNTTRTVRGRFLVGADGKTGFTRKQYLEPQGITLDRSATAHYEKDWVALNWKISLPTPETHPDFPLWEKGFTPQQVYDTFFPKDFRFLCNHRRPAVCGRFGLEADRLWRFEFVVQEGEDSNEMASPAQIVKVVYPYITHPGRRYGLSVDHITFPQDCIEVLRCRPFRFSARSCNKWALGRVLLCGDAAHVFPPFGGQGIASAFRDAISIVWRLRIATGNSPGAAEKVDYQKLFEGWYAERKQQLDKSLQSTVENGDYVTESNSVKIFVRNWYLWFQQLIPSWRHWLELGYRREGMVKYRWEDGRGMAFLPSLGGGGNLPQVYATAMSCQAKEHKVSFTDDLIFAAEKSGLFQVVAILSSAEGAGQVDATLRGLGDIAGGCLREDEATIFVDTTDPLVLDSSGRKLYRFATAAEFAADPSLCTGRPDPIGYDPHRMSKQVGLNKYVILRPDRFIFAIWESNSGLSMKFEKASNLIRVKGINFHWQYESYVLRYYISWLEYADSQLL